MIEHLGFGTYLVKMDGSGRVSRRRREFLKPVKPFFAEEAMRQEVDRVPEDRAGTRVIRRSSRLARGRELVNTSQS